MAPSICSNFECPVFAKRANDALNLNPPVADNNITTHGSDLNWAIAALHLLLLLATIAYTYITAPRKRIFHYLSLLILLIATIYYFVLASDLGSHAVPVEFRHGNIYRRTRQVFYARWVGYFLNFSLIWLALGLLSTVGWASILFTIGLTMLWATMFLVGELVRSGYKWGFWVIAVVIYGLLAWQVMGIARKYANRAEGNVGKIFTALAAWELFMMALYPISWALCEGGNVITNDSEQIFYAVIDVLSQGAFAVALLALTRNLDFDRLKLAFEEWGRVGRRSHRDGKSKLQDESATNNGYDQRGYQNSGATYGGTTTTAGDGYANGTSGQQNVYSEDSQRYTNGAGTTTAGMV